MTAARFEPSDDGEYVRVKVDLGPMVDPLVYSWPLAQLEQVVAQCRARQLGADVWGNL